MKSHCGRPVYRQFTLMLAMISMLLLYSCKTIKLKIAEGNQSMVILPSWITQLGSATKYFAGANHSFNDSCESSFVDPDGYVYCAGATEGSIGEPLGGIKDAFVMKLDPNGGIVWIRQLGAQTVVPGGDTSKFDLCFGVYVDAAKNVYCAGLTAGSLGEGNGGGQDAFVMKLFPDGRVDWITQFGNTTKGPGGNTSLNDYCGGVAVDSQGNVFCSGQTASSIGEGNGGGSDAFVAKLLPDGSVDWVRQLGDTTVVPGGDTSAGDGCGVIGIDSADNIYCAGGTQGSLGEGSGGNYDAFVMKLFPNGNVAWITQLGDTTIGFGAADNSWYEACYGLAVSGGYVYCTGETQGSLGEANGGSSDIFVMKLDTTFGGISWVKQLGFTTIVPGGVTSQWDACFGVTADSAGNVYCSGSTAGSLGEAQGGNGDAVIVKFTPTGGVEWISQLGNVTPVPGGDTSQFDMCIGVKIGLDGSVYCTGYTQSSLVEPNSGNNDIFSLKFKPDGTL